VYTQNFFREFTLIHGENAISPQFQKVMEHYLAMEFQELISSLSEKVRLVSYFGYGNNAYHYFHSDVLSYCSCYIQIVTNTYYGQIVWQSVSGRIYVPTDIDIDPEDVIFLFSGFPEAEIKSTQFLKKVKPWFETTNINFEVETEDVYFADSTYLHFSFHEANSVTASQIEHLIGEFIVEWNEKSERQQRQNGLIHNMSSVQRTPSGLVLYMDMGSANAIRQLLETVGTLGVVQKVEITSFPAQFISEKPE
jgi:hypothetical protein